MYIIFTLYLICFTSVLPIKIMYNMIEIDYFIHVLIFCFRYTNYNFVILDKKLICWEAVYIGTCLSLMVVSSILVIIILLVTV